MNNNYVIIGKVIGTFGIKGECKVYPLIHNFNFFLSLKEIFFKDKIIFKKLKIIYIKIHKKIILIKFESIDLIEEAIKLKEKYIYIKKNAIDYISKKINKKNNFFEVKDFKVFTKKGLFLGVLNSFMETKAHKIYIVKNKENKEILIPAISEFIFKKDIKNKKIIINLIPGLVDNNED